MKRVPTKSLESFDKFFCKTVSVLLCSSMFPTLRSKMMIKLVKNHERVFKFFTTHHMNGLGLGNVTTHFLTVFLRHSNLQMWNINAVMLTQSFEGFRSFFQENQLHNSSLEQMFTVEHLALFSTQFRYLPMSHVVLKSLTPKTMDHTDAASDAIISGMAAPPCGTTHAATAPTTTVNIENSPKYR